MPSRFVINGGSFVGVIVMLCALSAEPPSPSVRLTSNSTLAGGESERFRYPTFRSIA